jgi:hypothetical protein
MYPPMQIMEDHGTGLSQGKIQKIQELKLLMNKHPQYHLNPDGTIRLAIFNSINGDDKLLGDELQQLRIMDRRLNGRTSPFTVF